MRHASALAAVLTLGAFLFSGCAEFQSMGGPEVLTKLLTGQLNVTQNQATGGVGSILSLAREKLSSMDFSTFTKFIPGSDTFMKAAQNLGAVTGPVRDLNGLQSAFSKLGMGPEMIGKFSGVLSDFVGKAGGDQAKNLLAAVLG